MAFVTVAWVVLFVCVFTLVSLPTDNVWKQYVIDHRATSFSREQLTVIVTDIERVRRREGFCNVLLFGLDSSVSFWLKTNYKGKTVFLNDDFAKIERVRNKYQNVSIYPVTYHTQLRRDKDKYKEKEDWAGLLMQLNPDVRDEIWHVVIVDGPAGHCLQCPGRFQSLYMSSILKRSPDALTVVDDCERPVDATFALQFFGKQALFLAVPRNRFLGLHPTVQCYYRSDNSPGVMQQ